MPEINKDFLLRGSYASKQLLCRDRIIAWSHHSRYRLGRELVKPHAGKKLLDYGCGDGTFLALINDLFPEAAGADIDPSQVRSCASRFTSMPGVTFALTDDLSDAKHAGAYDLVTCMEVLEHCLEDKIVGVVSDLRRLVNSNGTVLISVPVEIGPSLLGKEIIRTLAAWRRCGDYQYKETYRFRELCTLFFADASTRINRPVLRADFSAERPNFYHGHKGFNWRALRERLDGSFDVSATRFSPLGWLGGYVSSQAWFICKPRR
jgi:2-polyprenyl-3-methyl-5-hydroxy-6-metoxy-1,4-benzoquinol methylase